MGPIDLPQTPFLRRDLDISRRGFEALMRAGAVRQVLRGVYVAADHDDWRMRAAAVALVVPPHHVLIDRTAAWLHGVDVLTYGELATLPPIEIAAPPDLEPTGRRGIHGRNRTLRPGDIEVLEGRRLTAPRRTALDLGCNLSRRDAYAALNQFSHLRNALSGPVAADVDRFRGRRGVVQLRELLPLVDPRIESPGESWMRLAIHDASLPPPEPQVWIEADGVSRFRLDFAYPLRRVAVEYDGEEFHSQAGDVAYDNERRRWLRDHGWTHICVRSGDLSGSRLDAWTRQLRDALAPPRSNLRW